MSDASTRAQYWKVQLARAVPALVAGLIITFSADHSAVFGLIVFGSFAVMTGLVIAAGAFTAETTAVRVSFLAQASVMLLCGTGALALNATGAGTLFIVVITFASLTGFLELYLGLSARRKDPVARDWITVGVLTGMLALAVLLVPADYAVPWSVADKGAAASGILTSQIIVVGIIGAYAVLIGVYLVIGGLSSRWTARDEQLTISPAIGH